MKTITTLACTAAMTAGAAFADGHAQNWDMPMAYSATNFHSEQGVMFAERVKEYTNGAINITVHPGGSLFGGGDIKRAVQTGQVPIGERFMSAHANEAPLLGWDNLPFLATTYADNSKLWEAARNTVNAQLADLNLVALYTCPWPGQGFYFNKEVNSSADTQGIKFRSYNSATATFAEELGMIPVQVEAAELSQALATGVASAFISSGSTGYDRKVWEHLAADETGAACAAKSEELAEFYFAELAKNGMTVEDAGPKFLAELKTIGEKMTADWLETAGADGQAIIDAYNN